VAEQIRVVAKVVSDANEGDGLNQMKLAVLLSGGKDSLYACSLAMQKEEVACLITIVSRNEESYMFHTPNIRFARLQAEASGIPLIEYATDGVKEAELDDLKAAIREAQERYGIEGVVTGAILSVYQAARIQRICRELDIWCFNPLWHANQDAYMEDLIAAGFQVLIAGVFSYPFDASWLGRILDRAALDELRTIAAGCRITLTGEGGELETFVLDAPFFTKRIEIVKASRTYANYHGVYRIEEARLVEK
jgi:diphthine-ammonia ligase